MIRRTLPLLLIPALFACEPSREQYRDDLATTLCERADRCNNLDRYGGTFDDCLVEETANANDYWPSPECSDGKINDDLARICQDEVRAWACSGLESLGDFGKVNDKCKASTVCVDPSN